MEKQIEIREPRQPGWFPIDNEVITDHLVEIGVEGLAVYAVLVMHTEDHREFNEGSIATTLLLSLDSVRMSLLKLKEAGLISINGNVITLLEVESEQCRQKGGINSYLPLEFQMEEKLETRSTHPSSLSQKIMLRDRKICRWPGCVAEADAVHHILPRSQYPEVIKDPRNLISLCRWHHKEAHSCQARIVLFQELARLYGYHYSKAPYRFYNLFLK